MTRIFLTLAVFALALMAAAMVIGLSVGDLHGPIEPSMLLWARFHRLTGVAAALAVVLVNSIVVTYFIGTSRWCKEVVESYGLDQEFAKHAAGIKRRAFPWALGGMLTVVGVAALGAAADPATGRPGTAAWVDVHLAGAIVGWCLIAWTFWAQWRQIAANHRLIGRVMHQVQTIRADRGLEVKQG